MYWRAGATICRNISSCRIRAGAPAFGSAPIRGSPRKFCRNCVPRLLPRSADLASALALDPLHILVAEAEMVTDLVDHHVAHQFEQVLAAVAPVIEDRPAVEIDRVRMRQRIADALMRQRDAAIEAQEVERAV